MANTVGDINVEIGARLNKLDKAIADVNKKLDGLNKGQRNVRKESDFLQKKFSALGKQIAATFAVREVIQFGSEAVKLAGQLQGVQAGFDRLGGTPELMNDLTRATRGTVSELDLMQSAVKAGNFDIELGALPQLFEFASRRAQETGESVDYLVESIVTGIGRKSPLILDNLGISAVQLKEELGGVSMEAAGIGQVSEAVARIAQRSLSDMGEVTVTTTDKLAQASAEFENMQTAIGQRLSGAVESATGGFGRLFGVIAKLFEIRPSEQYREQAVELRTLSRQVLDTATSETRRSELISEIQSKYPQYLSNINAESMSYEQLQSALEGANKELENKSILSANTEAVQDAQEDVDKYNERIAEQKSRVEQLITEIERESGVRKQAGQSVWDYIAAVKESDTVYTGWFSTMDRLEQVLVSIYYDTNYLKLAEEELQQATSDLTRTQERLYGSIVEQASAQELAQETAASYQEQLASGSVSASDLRARIEQLRSSMQNLDITQEGSAQRHEDLYETVNALTKVLTDYEDSQNSAAQGTTTTTQAVEEQVSAVDRLFNRLQATDAILNNFKSGASIGVDFDAVSADVAEDEFLPNFEPLAGWDKTAEDIMNFKKQVQELSPVLANMFNLSDEAATQLAENLDMTASQFENTYNSAMGLAMAVQGALMNAFQNGGNVGEAMIEFLKNLVFRLAAAAAAAAVLAAIMSTITGGVTSFSSVFKSGFGQMSQLGGLLGLDGARASGGPVSAGGSYLVGENGPEIFTPSMSGMILPNSALSAPSIPSMNPTGNVSGQMVVTVVGEISGDNIRLVQENSTQRNNRAQRG